MADVKKSRSGIRIKSSERKKSANKIEKGTRKISQEEEEKESLAYKVISEEQTIALKELTPHELEAKLAEILKISNFHISLPEASILDYYVAGFWFTKEQNFTIQQASAFFTLLKALVDNIKEKHMTLPQNIMAFKAFLVGIGVENCPKSGGLECFDVNQAKIITNYFTDSLFQHYKLYEFLFTQEPEEEVITAELKIEVPPLSEIPFPPPLDEGMTEEVWREYIMTPPPSRTDNSSRQSTESKEEMQDKVTESDLVEVLLSTVKPETIKALVKTAADDIFGNFKVDMETKLKERENNYAARIGKR